MRYIVADACFTTITTLLNFINAILFKELQF